MKKLNKLLTIYKTIMKWTLKIITILIFGVIIWILGFKVIGTSYCYVKTPQTKEEADKVIEFCNGSLLFSVFLSKARAGIYEKYPDRFQNAASATDLISYYTQSNSLEHLERIESLTYIVTDESWSKEKSFYFLLDDDFFINNIPLSLRQKIFNNIYNEYAELIINDPILSYKEKKYQLDEMDNIKTKLKNETLMNKK